MCKPPLEHVERPQGLQLPDRVLRRSSAKPLLHHKQVVGGLGIFLGLRIVPQIGKSCFLMASPETGDQSPAIKGGGLVLPDQLLPPNLFVLPVSSPIVFPTLLAPLVVHHPRLVAMVEEAINRQRVIGLLQVREGEVQEKTAPGDLHPVGVAVKILKRLKMPDGSINLLVHSMKRFRTKSVLSDSPYIVVETEYLEDIVEKSDEMDALTRSVISQVKKLSEVNPFFTDEMRMAMINAPGPGIVADLVAFALALPRPAAQEFLETLRVKERFEKLLFHLKREQELADLQKKINDEVNTKITKLQREFFLKEQLKSYLEEDGKGEICARLRERIEAAGMPPRTSRRPSRKPRCSNPCLDFARDNITRSYLETRYGRCPEQRVARRQLAPGQGLPSGCRDHFGLDKAARGSWSSWLFVSSRKTQRARSSASWDLRVWAKPPWVSPLPIRWAGSSIASP